MIPVERYIFGNSVSYDRFCTIAKILARLVSSTPCAVSMAQLKSATGSPGPEIAAVCTSLERIGLAHPDSETTNKWVLACDPSMVTLEDVFRCALSEQKDSNISPSNALPGTVQLLLMQAMITINESLCRDLRRFSLDRLKTCAAGVLTTPHRRFSYASLDNDFRLPAPDRDATL